MFSVRRSKTRSLTMTGNSPEPEFPVLYHHHIQHIMDDEEDMINNGGDPIAGPSNSQEGGGGDAPLSKKAIKRAARQVCAFPTTRGTLISRQN
jgi:hypothetical protein